MNSQNSNSPIHRRSFIKGVGAATAGLMLANPFGAVEANTPVKNSLAARDPAATVRA